MTVSVLVVDDVPEVRTLLNVALGIDDRFEVIDLCGTAGEAIEAAERGHPDVIVLDVDLPDRDGLSAIHDHQIDVRRAPPHRRTRVPLIFRALAVTGRSAGQRILHGKRFPILLGPF